MWGDMYVLFIGKSRKKKSHSKALRKRLGSPKQDGGRGKPDTAEGEILERCVSFFVGNTADWSLRWKMYMYEVHV